EVSIALFCRDESSKSRTVRVPYSTILILSLSDEEGKRRNLLHMKTKTLSLILIPLLVCFSASSTSQAANPPPDGGYPGGNGNDPGKRCRVKVLATRPKNPRKGATRVVGWVFSPDPRNGPIVRTLTSIRDKT